jgi:elongation factor Ts
MAEITARAVAELREKTGAGMMECKKALTEANGDLEEAVTVLRKRLGNKVTNRSDRTAAEGIIEGLVRDDKRVGVLVELNSETDFVARNDDFKALAREIVQQIAAYGPGTVPADVEALLKEPYGDGTQTVGDRLTEAAGRIGEKLALSRFVRFGAPQGNVVGHYIHNPGGKIGVLVEVTGAGEEALSTLAREVALHIASANPQYLSEADVEEGILEKEREIARAQAETDPKMAGKPQQAIESMVNGRVRKFLEETVLLNQAYVRDPARTIGALVKETPGASVVRFARLRAGETQADAAGEGE